MEDSNPRPYPQSLSKSMESAKLHGNNTVIHELIRNWQWATHDRTTPYPFSMNRQQHHINLTGSLFTMAPVYGTKFFFIKGQ